MAFPLLQHFEGTEDLDLTRETCDMVHRLVWFPRMCRFAPGLKGLILLLSPTHHQGRAANVGAGIALLTSLEILHIRCMAPDKAFWSAITYFCGAQPRAGLTRLTCL